MDLQIGNVHGIAAVGNESTLLATLTADSGSDNKVEVDTAEKLSIGMSIDILVRATGSSSGGALARTITDIADVATAAVVTTVGGVAPVNEQQTLTQGGSGLTSYTLTYSGQTTGSIAAAATNADIKAALELLNNIDLVDVTGTQPKIVEFQGTLAGTNVAQMTSTPTGGTGTLTVTTTRAGVAAVNEQETITIVADGGTFTITYGGQTTSAIAWNASAAVVQAALEALSNIAPGDVTVTKASQVYTIEFTGTLASQNITPVTTSAVNLINGTVSVTYSGADVDPDSTYGIYRAGAYGHGPSKTNQNGGFSDRDALLNASMLNVSDMRTRLSNISSTVYTDARLNQMTYNDMVFAIRTNDLASSIKQ